MILLHLNIICFFPKIINLTLEALFLYIFGKVPREEAGAQRPFDIFLKLYKDSRIQASLKITTKSRKGTLLDYYSINEEKITTLLEITQVASNFPLPYPTLLGFEKTLLVIACL